MNNDLIGYKHIFDECASLKTGDFATFRDSPKWQFAVATGIQRCVPDYEALGIAVYHNLSLFNSYAVENTKTNLGYADPNDYHPCDTVDSRHIMMSVLCFTTLGKMTGRDIVEIGGGFGNWARLNLPLLECTSWTIIDLPFVIDLQKWYLKQVLSAADFDRVKFVTVDEFPEWVKTFDAKHALVIGAHSVSEIDWDSFQVYYQHLIRKAEHFFYATHNAMPNPILNGMKLTTIEKDFEVVSRVPSEQMSVMNTLYRKIG